MTEIRSNIFKIIFKGVFVLVVIVVFQSGLPNTIKIKKVLFVILFSLICIFSAQSTYKSGENYD